jgi:two-component sensor histidine kinase
VDSSAPDWYEEMPTRVRAVPVMRRLSATGTALAPEPVAVITRHTNLGAQRTPSRQELTFNECADELFQMIASGDFPDLGAPTGPRRGAPRASDGLIRLDVDGVTTFASPNALSAFNRMGFDDDLEGKSLAEVTDPLPERQARRRRVAAARRHRPGAVAHRRRVARGHRVLRAIPSATAASGSAAIVLSRDVTELRHQEQELITKDATIREIHHRVKNNLQTVASLLRIQARARTPTRRATRSRRRCAASARSRSCTTRSPRASRRTSTSTRSSTGAAARRRGRVGAQHDRAPEAFGSFGVLPSEYATPLALALTELVTNAVEHGLAGQEGDVEITADRRRRALTVQVRDTGSGLPEGKVGEGLGTQIVRTLIQGELGGTIDWHTVVGRGTEVTIDVPLRWIAPE